MDPRVEVIQRMRNQEEMSHSQFHQIAQGRPFDNIEQKREESVRFSSFKIRILLSLLLGIVLFSMKTSEQVIPIQRAMEHIGDYKTIEEAVDQVEYLVKQWYIQTKDI